MKKIELGQVITIIANLGVIIGIAFLAIELRQNNALLLAQNAHAQFSAELDRRGRFIDNTNGFAEIIVRQSSGTPLNPVEEVRLAMFANEVLSGFQWQFREIQADRLPENYLDLGTWRDIWDTIPQLGDAFEEDKAQLDSDFVQFMNENVINR